MRGDDGVERSIILLVLLAIAERKLARLALGKRYARRAPGAGIGQLVHLVAIDRARLAVRIPRARHAIPTAGGKCGLELRRRITARPGLLEPQRKRPAHAILVKGNVRDANAGARPKDERAGTLAAVECAGDPELSVRRAKLIRAVRRAVAARGMNLQILRDGRKSCERCDSGDQRARRSHHAPSSPTMPRRNARTHTMKMNPVITVTHSPYRAR